MKPYPVITIDGLAGTGKGTLARRLACHYVFDCLDTGLLYRATAAQILFQKIDPRDEEACASVAQHLTPAHVSPSPALRTEEIGQLASQVSAHPKVRDSLFQRQRDFALHPPLGRGAVLDGRDMGTVIFPEALCKIFLTAQLEVRVARRFQELQGLPEAPSYTQIHKEITERDGRDSQRTVAPLKPADDAHVLDTSTLSPDEVFSLSLSYCDHRLSPLMPPKSLTSAVG
jgi:cytidylate kinase